MTIIRIIIIRNNTSEVQDWVREFDPNEEFQIQQDSTVYYRYKNNENLLSSIANGDASIGNGTIFLESVSDQLNWLLSLPDSSSRDEMGRHRIAIESELHGQTHNKDGLDEINVEGLSGVLEDKQHIIEAEAISAMGAKGNTNPLNHDRFQQSEIINLNETQTSFGSRLPTTNEKDAMAANNPSSFNPYITESKGDVDYAPLTHTHEGGSVIPDPPNDGNKNIITETNSIIQWEELGLGGSTKRTFEMIIHRQDNTGVNDGDWLKTENNYKYSGSWSGYSFTKTYPKMIPYNCKVIGITMRARGAEHEERSSAGDLRYKLGLYYHDEHSAYSHSEVEAKIYGSFTGSNQDYANLRSIDNSPVFTSGTNTFQEGDMIGLQMSEPSAGDPGDISKFKNPVFMIKFEEL